MKKVMQTWDSIYWLAPKTDGLFIKTKFDDIGWGPKINGLDKLFDYTNYAYANKLFDKVK